MIKSVIQLFSGRQEIELESNDQKELIRLAAFFTQLPHECPLCAAPIHFQYRKPEKFEFWGLECDGINENGKVTRHECTFGQYQDREGFFYKGSSSWKAWGKGDDEPPDLSPDRGGEAQSALPKPEVKPTPKPEPKPVPEFIEEKIGVEGAIVLTRQITGYKVNGRSAVPNPIGFASWHFNRKVTTLETLTPKEARELLEETKKAHTRFLDEVKQAEESTHQPTTKGLGNKRISSDEPAPDFDDVGTTETLFGRRPN